MNGINKYEHFRSRSVPAQKSPFSPHNAHGDGLIVEGHLDTSRSNDLLTMQNLRNHTTTILDPDIQSRDELYYFTERLSSGLPGLQGNALMLLRIGVPTPSGDIVLPSALRERMRVQFYFDIAPDKKYIRHVRPDVDAEKKSGDPHTDASGPLYKLWISRLPIPHKHQVFDRLGL